MTSTTAADDRIEVRSSRLWALFHFNLTRWLFPARMIADHVGVSTNIVLFWLTPWRRTDEHLPMSHIAEVAHTRGLIWDRISVESSGGLNPLVVRGPAQRAGSLLCRIMCASGSTKPSLRRRCNLAVELQSLLAGADHDLLAVLDAAGEDHFRQRILHRLLDHALERPRAVGRIPAFFGQPIARRGLELDGDLAILQKPRQALHLDVDDAAPCPTSAAGGTG